MKSQAVDQDSDKSVLDITYNTGLEYAPLISSVLLKAT